MFHKNTYTIFIFDLYYDLYFLGNNTNACIQLEPRQKED